MLISYTGDVVKLLKYFYLRLQEKFTMLSYSKYAYIKQCFMKYFAYSPRQGFRSALFCLLDALPLVRE